MRQRTFMNDFTYRFRFRLPKSEAIDINEPTCTFAPPLVPSMITLKSRAGEKPIKESRDLVVLSSGWPSIDVALEKAQRCTDALALAMVRLGGAIDFDRRKLHGMITDAGLEILAEEVGQSVVRDDPGVSIYATVSPPRFASLGGIG